MCPAWLLVAVVVVGVARGAVSQCWEQPSCQELDSESSVMVTHLNTPNVNPTFKNTSVPRVLPSLVSFPSPAGLYPALSL